MSGDQTAEIAWRGPVPVSTRFQDPYFSLQDGLAETRHVFLRRNDLPERFVPGFHVAELGFGTGLNFLATWEAWRRSGQSGLLHYTSFELYPLQAPEMRQALQAFPEVSALAERLLASWDTVWDSGGFQTDEVALTVILGDARETLPNWQGRADAWFLDGFAPAQNPELWEPDLLQAVGARTAPGGSCATYSAAGHIRRSLADAGFEVQRVPGFGAKRHMTIGRKPDEVT